MNFQLISCAQNPTTSIKQDKKEKLVLKMGSERMDLYLELLKGKNVAVVANQTSVLERKENGKQERAFVHIVDSLLSLQANIKKVFAPEHGFRGKADAGELVKDGIDTKTGLPIISLYGKNKKPSKEQLSGIDFVVFDIQDVGARFYTYISTLHYVMEACAELNIPVIILDRPNPNAHYIDGPIMELAHTSFVGMHKVPVVYGMTIGEYGQMINGEKWLAQGIQCNLSVIPLENYTHKTEYNLPIIPSPNLPNDKSINLYPSLCFFEGTNVSAGRGTDKQFQIIGSPFYQAKQPLFSFIPQPNVGSKYPKNNGKVNFGYDLRKEDKLDKIELKWVIDFYKNHKNNSKEKQFFTPYFTTLAGTKKLQQQIENGLSEAQIRKSWQKDLEDFQKIRLQYLMY